MSVRRLAEDHVQPPAFAFNADNADWAAATIRKYPDGRQQSAIIPLLMRAQEQEGWVTKAAIEGIADMLSMPYIRALEVATFYTQFQLKPVGTRAHVQVCGTTPCMLRGSEDLMRVCREKIHSQPFHTNETGTLSWEEVECQGACVNAPMVMIFKDAYEDLTPEQLADIIDRFDAGEGASVAPGPQNGRHLSAPLGGATTLLDEEAMQRVADRDVAERAVKPSAPEGASGGEEAVEKGRPAQKGVPLEADPTVASPQDAKGPGGPSKTKDEAGGEPADPKQAEGDTAPAASGRTGGDRTDAPAATTASTQAAPVDEANKPAPVEKPAQPDDLKLISGIGPRIEAKLNDLGIWTYERVASLTAAERAWVDDHLKFSGRIERDDWVRQAEALAKGGEAEYIRVFGKKPR